MFSILIIDDLVQALTLHHVPLQVILGFHHKKKRENEKKTLMVLIGAR